MNPNQDVLHTLTKARAALIMDQPFFGTLALRLKLVPKNDMPMKTLAVDGVNIYYDEEFIATLAKQSLDLIKSAIAHEVGHCVFEHVARRGDRNPRKWNMAGDYVINAMLKDAGFQLGEKWLHEPAFAGMTTDHIYSLLPEDDGKAGDQGNQAGGGNGQSQGDPLCDVLQAPHDAREVTAQEWKVATIQAANAAKAQGKLPGALQRFVEEMTGSRVNWREQLRRFITERSKDDYSWSRFNRRFAAQGIYLPSLYSETMGEIVVVVDTSGSIDDPTLKAFGAEITAIRDTARPAKTHVIYCDEQIAHVDVFEPNDEFKIEGHGGGGTDFRPPFDYAADHNLTPVCLVYLTDLCGPMHDSPPDYPVMWCCTTEQVAKWGETLRIEV